MKFFLSCVRIQLVLMLQKMVSSDVHCINFIANVVKHPKRQQTNVGIMNKDLTYIT